ncbi:MAG TPA: QVPTGV class sortase B protein-sorting domain-containing protein, partial [Candidatus Eisenbergiella intestinigallinarum]|nr:QVPTGV class sortase B protein-sorting domain-containing protein [Candidatus Eisenbergiella intestinigallinarum]
DCSGEGYVTKIDNEKVEDGNYTSTGNLNADKTIVYENIRNASTPTGVVLNIAPYIAMVALAGVLAFVFLRRRHNNF